MQSRPQRRAPPTDSEMAGTRHHYNPRWLQAGFADNGAGSKSRVWLYRKGWHAPKHVATKDVGLEEHFYAYGVGEERRNADEPMTAAERDLFAPLARRLREAPLGPLEDEHESLSELLAHIEVRTKAFRDYVTSASAPLAAALTAHVQRPESFRPYLAQLVEAQPAVFQEALASAGMSISSSQLKALVAGSDRTPYSPTEEAGLVRFQALPWSDILANAMKAGHVEALIESVVSDGRKRHFADCDFSVVEPTSACFVQGDAPLTFRMRSGRYNPLVIGDEPIDFAYLPLSPGRLLVAQRRGAALPAWQELRAANLVCSRDYFIGAQDSGELQALVPLLGTEAPRIDDTVTQAWMQEALQETLNESACSGDDCSVEAATRVLRALQVL